MNNQKSESKSGDHDDNDHIQPINLVAARTAVPVTSFSTGTTVTTQPLPMRTHMDPKPGLMTLYFRTPAPRTQGQVMGPIVGAQVSSSQHFTAKSAQDFKNTTSWTVIRMPTSDITQVQGGTTTSSGGTLTPGILPSALSGGSNRHMIPTAVQPIIAAGHSGPSMASIIRGSHQVSPAGHVIHPPFSSHVPRGPAAVANISAAPKSAVATPILRTSHTPGTMALASSSMMALHGPVRAKSPTLAGRTATPPVVATTSLSQASDLQKSTIGHTLPSSATHVGLSPRSLDGSVVRTGNTHTSAITIAKPVNISQPIVQHLQQVCDKGGTLKAVSNIAPVTTTAPISSSHQSMSSVFTSVNETGGVSTISRAPISSSYTSNIMQLSTNSGQTLQPLRAAHVPQTMHTLTNVTTTGNTHQTLTVIAAKTLQTNHSIALATSAPRSATPITTVSAGSGNISIVPGPTPRSLTITNAITPTSIPVAKVYPQSTSNTRISNETTTQENSRPGSFLASISNTARVTTPSATTSNNTSILCEKPSESTSSRFSTMTKSQTGSGNFTPSTTYLYHDQYNSSINMHPYNSNTPQSFSTTQLRPVSFSQHSSSNTSSHSSSSVSNPVMVAVDSRHHVAMHPSYSNNSAKASDLTTTSLSSGTTSSVTTTTVTTSYNTTQSQSTVNNHTSPRPSILRKRASESTVCSIAKKNLTGPLSASEPTSPHPDLSSNVTFASVLSPKPSSIEKPKEVVPPVIPVVSESQNILIPVIPTITVKKELGTTENSNSISDLCINDRPVEASPRKKPRKQLLAANDLMETHSSDGEENNFDVKMKIKEEPGLQDDDKTKCVTFYKRPSMSLLSTYRQSWKARYNHFARYTDVKPKEEKKPTVSELANQKGILQQVNGWKIYHLSAQMDEVINLEESVYSRLSDLLDFVENDPPAFKNWNCLNSDEVKVVNKLTDLIKGNLQRSKIVQEQVTESKKQAVKILDHKGNVIEMINKYISKRPLKKKDKS